MTTSIARGVRSRKRETTREKVTLSLPRTLVEAAQAEVQAGHAPSLSAYVATALAERLERASLEEVLDAMDLAYGPPSAEDEAWARQVLGL